jgi:TRAP-type mannitol/chloroaromatic compound transport system permease large subunit
MFTDKIEQVTKKSAIDGFNHLIDKTRRTRRASFVGALWTATTGGVAALGTGIINVGTAS